MEWIAAVLGVLLLAALAGAGWLLVERGRVQGLLADARARAERAARADELAEENAGLGKRIAALEGEIEAAAGLHRAELDRASAVMAEQVKAVEGRERMLRDEIAQTRAQMREAFGTLSAEALSKTTGEFLKLAGERLGKEREASAAELEKRRAAVEQLVKPIAETLAKTDAKLGQIESAWTADRATLAEQMRAMGVAGQSLQAETAKLVRALREPHIRGRYGELQLRRVAELAGMSPLCDFAEQSQTVDADGNALKPDMVVKLPSGRVVVVDAKTNIRAYLEALEAGTEPEREACLERFARHVGEQATALARKKYWSQYDGSPEFVVMFIPGDQFIDAALSRQPEILERAAMQNVLLAGPATLIGLLRAVAVGYHEQKLAEAAEELRDLGIELHERAAVAFGHISKLGASLNAAVDRYNDFVGSYEKRLEPALRRFEGAGARSGKELPEVGIVEAKAKTVHAELADGAERA
jgi:DNA recombination protein RmuC